MFRGWAETIYLLIRGKRYKVVSADYAFAHKLLPEASADHLGGCLVNWGAGKYVLLGVKCKMILCY